MKQSLSFVNDHENLWVTPHLTKDEVPRLAYVTISNKAGHININADYYLELIQMLQEVQKTYIDD